MTIAIQCRNIIKSYGAGDTKVMALRGVNIDVGYGELLMLVGPSGCGKTTLISVMTAILLQDSGECEVAGHNLSQMDERERALFRADSIGFVFQKFNLLPALTAAENVSLPMLINGLPAALAESRAREILDRMGLSDRADVLPSQLSGGQQQRVAIARALAHDPKLIVCDEPTSSLDHTTGLKVMDMIKALARDPERAVIVVTHDNRILEYADRVAHMEDGKVGRITGPVKILQ